ncbi:contractile injection system tape measure protein [uncultured Cyclobacterium sp.]|uniref:contractile injection system tape measure protein n=1 Tax=uncultured Cyclobacterium sp. TaxID=453820 RepID=UPI0030EB72BA|tara:strand:+ start:504439 stop:505917 length:1479 start_codon:yes stop_codon:yes gene_type:complete
MKENDTHAIQKVSIDIYSKSVDSAKAIERNINTFIQDSLMPLIASYLDELEKELQIESIQIPHINITLNLLEDDFLDPKIIQRAFMNQFQEVLSREIAKKDLGNFQGMPANDENLDVFSSLKKEGHEISALNPVEQNLKSWIYFLDNGRLPWWYSQEKARKAYHWQEIKPLVSKYFSDGKLLKYFQKSLFFDRVISQYSGGDLAELIWMAISRKPLIQKFHYLKIIKRLKVEQVLVFYRIIIAASLIQELNSGNEQLYKLYLSKVGEAERKIVEKTFREVIKFDDINERKKVADSVLQLLEDKNQYSGVIPNIIRESSAQINVDAAENREGYYVSNAGLILLHPFLKPFFIDCELLDEKGQLINPETAVHALHYLSTKKEQPFDFELVFEKYLVGMPIDQPVLRALVLSEEIKINTEKLLNALKVNWKSLKNTGLETIRNEFINRGGKLVFEETSDRLFVERKAQDILLDGVPWNLSLVKLPWQKKHLLVDW